MYLRRRLVTPVQILKRTGAQSMQALPVYFTPGSVDRKNPPHQVLDAIACREVYW